MWHHFKEKWHRYGCCEHDSQKPAGCSGAPMQCDVVLTELVRTCPAYLTPPLHLQAFGDQGDHIHSELDCLFLHDWSTSSTICVSYECH